MIAPEEAIKEIYFPLPIFQVDIDRIDVHLAHEFNSIKGPNVQPSSGFRNTIYVHYGL